MQCQLASWHQSHTAQNATQMLILPVRQGCISSERSNRTGTLSTVTATSCIRRAIFARSWKGLSSSTLPKLRAWAGSSMILY